MGVKITDPDDLNVATEIAIDTTAKTFTLSAAGNLTAKDGVTLQAIYSKFIDLWTTDSYNKYPFPMYTIDARSGQFLMGTDGATYNGWKPANDTTRQMIRDAGWSEYSSLGVLNRQYVGIVALASGFPGGAQFYYQTHATADGVSYTFTDAPNQGIQVFGDTGNGDFDFRSYYKMFCREYNYTYDDAVLGDVGETATGAYKVSLPIAVGSDLKITDNDTNVSTLTPYTAINIKYFSGAFTRDVATGVASSFGIVIDVGTHSGIDGSAPGGASVLTTAAAGMSVNAYAGGTLTIYEGTDKNVSFPIVSNAAGTITVTGTIASGSNLSFTAQKAAPTLADLDEIYTKIQYQLRQTGNINAASGTVKGNTAAMLLNFVGDTLKAGYFAPANSQGGGSGVIIQGLQSKDINTVVFYDNAAATAEFGYASAGTLNFNSYLTAGSTGYYRMYFTDLAGDLDYGLVGAITVDDASAADIAGTITGASIAFSFDYTNNNQGGRTPNTPAAVTVVAGNAGSAKPVVATGTITASKSIVFTLTAEQDRAYVA
jgi:hypothetical protein